jgi:hypothetical protein
MMIGMGSWVRSMGYDSKACPKKNGHYHVMELHHAKKHIMQAIYIHHANYLKQRLMRLQHPVQVEPEALLDDKDNHGAHNCH